MAITKPDKGWLDKPKNVNLNKYMIIDGKAHEIHSTIVHTFKMGDVDDPDLYAAEPLWQWQQSEMGKWVMERAVQVPEWHRQADPFNYGYHYAIVAKLKGIDYTFWTLKWGNQKNA